MSISKLIKTPHPAVPERIKSTAKSITEIPKLFLLFRNKTMEGVARGGTKG